MYLPQLLMHLYLQLQLLQHPVVELRASMSEIEAHSQRRPQQQQPQQQRHDHALLAMIFSTTVIGTAARAVSYQGWSAPESQALA